MVVVRDAPAIVDAHEPPYQMDGRRTFLIATWNIQIGRKNRLEDFSRAVVSLGVNIGFLHETKLN